jgi:hypothetical protein
VTDSLPAVARRRWWTAPVTLVVAGLVLIVAGAPLLGSGITDLAATSASIGGTAKVVGALAMLLLGILTSAAGLAWWWLAWRRRTRDA